MIRKPRTAVRRAAAAVVLAGLVGGAAAAAADASPIRFHRVYGADRYITSSLVDGDPTSTAYVVSGVDFPDGLAAGAVAGREAVLGNVYLTQRDVLPAEVRQRIVYASKIVVVGGESSVGPDVMTWLQQNTRATLSRVSGPDRFDTAAALSAASYATPAAGARGVENVVIATGYDYPDALSGSAAAAHVDSPLLLVRPDAVPASVVAELQRLRPQAITVVGGTSRVTDSVLEQLRTFTTGPVTRIAGTDRYDTADRVSAAFFDDAEDVTIASGETFADALAAGARAGRHGGPLLLTASRCLTEQTNLEIERLQATHGERADLDSIGGPTRITEEAAKRTNCQPVGTAPKTYLDDLVHVQGSVRDRYDHATISGRFYPRSTAFDADPRNSDYGTWSLGTKRSRFTMVAGIADDNPSALASTVAVYGDEKLLASGNVAKGAPIAFDVDVRGVDNLKIVTTSPNASLTPAAQNANLVYFGDAAVS
ncbi:cell wall-binding repeat-containing protein [Kineococcus aurantiacus]|uniref:Putative cell wall-binding protein n=1 Tax=Kineococcus aurantiacus TaxID=37633 RepID=A0A7Y9ASY5_9ACTN|nr:cell wall-binding repeat-containing protein [Kineococcus aurantiacus]NYD20813.1 putative cell wall-binding protein [Kineococcus aurantiacus]